MTEQPSLADLGRWPRAELGSRSVIRHAYENVLTASARLFSFASGYKPTSDGPIEQQQEMLAVDDLLAFAIHSRRLIGNTISLERANRTAVQAITENEKTYIPITRIINILIHHKNVDVIRTAERLRIRLHASTFDDFMAVNQTRIEPLCIAVSDKNRGIGFRIHSLIDVFQEEILGSVIELCAEQNLFLENVE